MRMVVISYPDNQQQETLLADVPRIGDRIHLSSAGRFDPLLVVESITWMEGTQRDPEPSVIVGVRQVTK